MPDTISPHVKAYLRRIGAKGGRAQKGTPQRKELNTRAAEIRWRKFHPKPSPIDDPLDEHPMNPINQQ